MQFTTGSTRKFAIVFIEGDSTNSHPCLTLDEIVFNHQEWEYNNAIKEEIDKVLDLKPGEKLQLKFNRDNKDSDGFLKRIR